MLRNSGVILTIFEFFYRCWNLKRFDSYNPCLNIRVMTEILNIVLGYDQNYSIESNDTMVAFNIKIIIQ